MIYTWHDSESSAFSRVISQHFVQLNEKIRNVSDLYKMCSNMQDADVGLICGKAALEFLQEQSVVQKNKSMNALRGTPLKNPVGGGRLLLTYAPGMVNYDYARKADIMWDVQLTSRLHTLGHVDPVVGEYRYVKDFTDVVKKVQKLHSKTGLKVPVATDLETMGLVAFDSDKRIVSISMTVEEGRADVIWFQGNAQQPALPLYDEDLSVVKHKVQHQKLYDQLEWLMTSDTITHTGANLKFDESWTREKWGLSFENFQFDTTLVGSIIDENRSNSLNMHAKIYTPMGGYDDEFNKTHDKGHMENIDPVDLLPYAGGDTDACFRTRAVMKDQLMATKSLARFYVKVLHPASKVFSKLESRGMLVDVDVYEKLKVKVSAEVERLEGEIFGMMPRKLKLKYSDNLSLGRAIILQEFLFTPRGLGLKPKMYTAKAKDESHKYASTSLEHFEMFDEVPEAKAFVDAMRAYNSATKTMSTYIVGFMKHIRQDGRFHPSYMLHRGDYGGGDAGTVTGRLSAKDPAFQTIPKHTIWAKPLREVYIAPDGYLVLNVDFSQGELRVAACVANEPTMIETYKQGIDVHLRTGLALYNIQNPHDQLTLADALELKKHGDKRVKVARQGGKAGNFGLLYGMQPPGFREYARKTYGVALELEQAEKFRDGFFDMYEELPAWHEKYIQLAHENKFVQNPLGRIRHLPLIDSPNWGVRSKQERQAINSPIQSTLSDLTLMAMVEIDRHYPDLHMFGMTHDSISLYVPEEDGIEWAKRIINIMENLPIKALGWEPQLTFGADAELGPNLAAVEELDL